MEVTDGEKRIMRRRTVAENIYLHAMILTGIDEFVATTEHPRPNFADYIEGEIDSSNEHVLAAIKLIECASPPVTKENYKCLEFAVDRYKDLVQRNIDLRTYYHAQELIKALDTYLQKLSEEMSLASASKVKPSHLGVFGTQKHSELLSVDKDWVNVEDLKQESSKNEETKKTRGFRSWFGY